MKGIYISSNEGDSPSLRGDNSKRVKIHRRNSQKIFSRTRRPISIKLNTKDNLCQVCLKLTQWLWRRGVLNDPTPFLHFCDYLPFEKDMALHLNKLQFRSTKDNLIPVRLNLAMWFWRRFFKILQCIFTLLLLSPLGEGLIPFI